MQALAVCGDLDLSRLDSNPGRDDLPMTIVSPLTGLAHV